MARQREQADIRLLSKVAKLYYEQRLTQLEIGERLGLSRPKVSRLLHAAEKVGIVRISVLPAPGVNLELEKQLETKFGLQEAVVVEVTEPQRQEIVSRELGIAGAQYLQRAARDGDLIGVSWGTTLSAMVNALQPQAPRSAHVVQLIGGLGPPEAEVHATSLCRRLAQVLGCKLTLVAAPGIVDSRKVKAAIHSDSHMQAVLELYSRMRMACVGIGAPTPDSVLMRDGTIMSREDLEDLCRKGAAGDIALRFFDIHGHPIRSELDERVIGITLDELKRTPVVVGIAGGPHKYKAVRGALEGRLIDVLITDHALAQGLVQPAEPPP